MRINQFLLNKGYKPTLKDNKGCTLYTNGAIPSKECFYSAYIEIDEKTLEIKDYWVDVDAHIVNEMEFKTLEYLYKELNKIVKCIKNRRTE